MIRAEANVRNQEARTTEYRKKPDGYQKKADEPEQETLAFKEVLATLENQK